jgi:hypothetical protein
VARPHGNVRETCKRDLLEFLHFSVSNSNFRVCDFPRFFFFASYCVHLSLLNNSPPLHLVAIHPLAPTFKTLTTSKLKSVHKTQSIENRNPLFRMMSSTSSVQPSTQHIRRTSAGIAQFNTISAEGGILPFVSSLIYNERNGQIYLPPSPLGSPLTSSFPSGVNKPRSLWNEKESRYSSTSKPDCGTGTTGFNRIHRNYFTALLFCCTIFSLYSFNSHFSSATALM